MPEVVPTRRSSTSTPERSILPQTGHTNLLPTPWDMSHWVQLLPRVPFLHSQQPWVSPRTRTRGRCLLGGFSSMIRGEALNQWISSYNLLTNDVSQPQSIPLHRYHFPQPHA